MRGSSPDWRARRLNSTCARLRRSLLLISQIEALLTEVRTALRNPADADGFDKLHSLETKFMVLNSLLSLSNAAQDDAGDLDF